MSSQMSCMNVCVMNCDSYVGQCIARYMLKESDRAGRRRECEIRVTATNPKCCDKLRDMGAKVCEIDYSDPRTLRKAFKDCCYVVFVPEMTKSRIRDGECAIECLCQEQVDNVVMCSLIGADCDNKLECLHEFGKLERCMMNKMDKGSYCILRLGFVDQACGLWANMMEHDCKMMMPIGDQRCAPVNMNDICEVCYCIVCGQRGSQRRGMMGVGGAMSGGQQTMMGVGKQSGGFEPKPMDKRHHKQCYTLTGPGCMSGHDIAREMKKALDVDIKFESCSRNDTKQYLMRLRKDQGFQQMCMEDEMMCCRMMGCDYSKFMTDMSGMKMQGGATGGAITMGGGQAMKMQGGMMGVGPKQMISASGIMDYCFGRPTCDQLTDTMIETMLDMFECCNMGKTDFVSGDMEKLIDQKGEALEEWVGCHKDQFCLHGRAMA